MASKYTKEHIEYLKEISKEVDYNNEETVKLFNKKFNLNVTVYAISKLKQRNGIKNESIFKYGEEHIKYLKEINFGKSSKEITELFNKKFNLNKSVCSINSLRKRHKISIKNTGQFKKGYTSLNKKSIGSERVNDSGGKIFIKIEEPDVWVAKHRYLYEKYNNVILTEKDVIIFLNGDVTDFSKENLFKLEIGDISVLNANRIKMVKDRDINKAKINLVKLKRCISKKSKELRR